MLSEADQNDVPIRVLVVDDHAMVAEGMATILGDQDDIDVVAVAGTVADALRLAATRDPNVVVMDYRLPDGQGTEAARRIREEDPRVQIVMVTASGHDTVLADALDAGCAGFVTKDRAADDVVAAVRAAHAGEATIPPAMLARLLPRLRSNRRDVGVLTPREQEILQLLAQGLSNSDITERLVVSPSTVRNHVQNILRKLDAHSRLEAVATAVREGLVRPPD